MKTEEKKVNQPQTQSITWNELTWVDMAYPGTAETDSLAQNYHFHPIALEDSISRGQLSKVDDYGSYLLLILHFPGVPAADTSIKSNWLAVFVGNDYIITLHDDLRTLTDLFTACQLKQTKQEYFVDGPGYLIYRILDHLIEICFPILNKLLTRMDGIEDRVFDESGDDTRDIATLRRDIIAFRRIIFPSRSVINDFKIRVKPFTTQDLSVYFDNLIDQLNRVWDNLEESKEVIEVFKDSDFVLVTNRINRIVQTLTIISSIFLPFLVVSSLYGMNVFLPGGIINGTWLPFGILIGVMFIISGSMLYFFRRRHWI